MDKKIENLEVSKGVTQDENEKEAQRKAAGKAAKKEVAATEEKSGVPIPKADQALMDRIQKIMGGGK